LVDLSFFHLELTNIVLHVIHRELNYSLLVRESGRHWPVAILVKVALKATRPRDANELRNGEWPAV
jgi:hypothetical protein